MSTELPFAYHIRRSQRASRARIVVKPGQVEIVAPFQVPEHKLHQFVQAKQQWITQALNKMAAASPQQTDFVPAQYKTGAEMTYLGNHYPLMLKPSKLKRVKVEFADGYTIHVPDAMKPDDCQPAIREAMIRWMKKQTKQHVEQMVEIHASKQQLFPRAITIKTQKSRWGSCGIHNDININWLLIMAPKEVLEYVVVHELCHIKVKNHSSKFWSLVAEHMPDYQNRRNWLKKQGRSLMLAFSDQPDR
ncbi:MAG: SprT family zinc-dependent metalloprotease [Methyloglobulus sp.]|nr:M48 family metallopeptidase [Methyloglobulus sp.]